MKKPLTEKEQREYDQMIDNEIERLQMEEDRGREWREDICALC